MNKSTWKIVGIVLAVLSAAVAVVSLAMGGCTACVETAAGGCVPMKCHWTFRAVAGFAALGTVALLGLAFTGCKVGRRWLAFGGFAAQALVLVALHTGMMGLCGDATMHCHVTAVPCTVLAVVAAVGCVVLFVLADPKRAQLPKRGL